MRIKITATPPGQATEWVRRAWVGLELTAETPKESKVQVGVLGGSSQNAGGYEVLTNHALGELRKKDPKASRLVYEQFPCRLWRSASFFTQCLPRVVIFAVNFTKALGTA